MKQLNMTFCLKLPTQTNVLADVPDFLTEIYTTETNILEDVSHSLNYNVHVRLTF